MASRKEKVIEKLMDDESDDVLRQLLWIHDEVIRPAISKDERRLDYKGPTLSTIIKCFDILMHENTPHLYKSEWELLRSLEMRLYELTDRKVPRFFGIESVGTKRNMYVGGLEDLPYSQEVFRVNPFELSRKVANFSNIQVMAVAYNLQLSFAAAGRNEAYKYPKIPFNG